MYADHSYSAQDSDAIIGADGTIETEDGVLQDNGVVWEIHEVECMKPPPQTKQKAVIRQ